VWACLPRPDGDPVFCSLLSRDTAQAENGSFAIELLNLADTGQTYIRNTAILETTLRDSRGGTVKVTDFCPRFRARGRVHRPMMLVRIIEPMGGRPVIRLCMRPSRSYGAESSVPRCGTHSIRFAADGVDYRVTTDASLSAVTEGRLIGLDRPLVFILGPDETIDETPAILAQSLLAQTQSYWQDWVRTLAIPYDWQEAVIRAAITLKLCTFEDTGAVLAALTTSIPEAPDSGRNWDYRYCWLRDSYFVIQALNRLGATRTMEAYLQFLDHIVAGHAIGDLQPLYAIGGGSEVEERIVDTLEGFLGMGPVRVGNQAAKQVQHDVYGAIVLATSQLFFDDRLVSRGDKALFERLEPLGHRAAALYDKPDAGPWELRGAASVHTFSATMSWAGCDRLARIAGRLGLSEAKGRWRRQADLMRTRILAGCWNSRRNSFVGSFGGDELDASTLLLAEVGLVAPDDPRFVATVEAVGTELRVGDHLYRYRHADDFGEPETAFTICSFWYVNALAATGKIEQAREHFSRLLERRNPLGILSEDLDPVTGMLWGNYPQTYSMVGIVNSAVRLSRSWEEAL
jgi:GH15 family glucan-1,4-alpha-glucosidase